MNPFDSLTSALIASWGRKKDGHQLPDTKAELLWIYWSSSDFHSVADGACWVIPRCILDEAHLENVLPGKNLQHERKSHVNLTILNKIVVIISCTVQAFQPCSQYMGSSKTLWKSVYPFCIQLCYAPIFWAVVVVVVVLTVLHQPFVNIFGLFTLQTWEIRF